MDMDTIIQTLSPALRLALLKSDDQEYLYILEEKITRFLKDAQPDKLFLEPNLNSYYRMLSYNVAEYYKLRHILLKQEDRLALYKQCGVDEENGIVQVIDESKKLKNLCKRKLAESLQMTKQDIAALNDGRDNVQQNVSQVVTKKIHSSPDLQQDNTSPTLSFFTMPCESTSSFTSSMTSSLSFDNKSNSTNERRSDSSMSSVGSDGKKSVPKKNARKDTSAATKKKNYYSNSRNPRKHVHSQYNNGEYLQYGQYWMGPPQQFVPQVYMYPHYAYVPETEYLAMGDDIKGEEFMEEIADTPRGSYPRYVPMSYMYGPPPSLCPPPHMGPHFQIMPVPFSSPHAAQPPMQFHPQYLFPPPPQPFISEQNEELPPSC